MFFGTKKAGITLLLGYWDQKGWDQKGWDQNDRIPKHQTKDSSNSFKLWALSFAARNRVASLHLQNPSVCLAKELDPCVFLPSSHDWVAVRGRMEVLVCRILVQYMECLGDLHGSVVWHLPHLHTEEMSKKSELVNLGVLAENPSTTKGTIRIMDHLHKYVPGNVSSLVPVIANGDQLSVERSTCAKKARVRGPTSTDRLDGMVETPQEFHKEGLLLQDTMKTFFKRESLGDRGTMYQMKEFFRHRSLKEKVMENFQHAWDFNQFVTEGLILSLFAKLVGIKAVEQEPNELKSLEKPRKKEWLRRIAARIVDRVWNPTCEDDIRDVILAAKEADPDSLVEDYEYPYCVCRADSGDDMVQCCNSTCTDSWFHLQCAQLQAIPEGDWYCSPMSRLAEGYVYCLCKKKWHENVVQCRLKDACKHSEYYHPSCLGLDNNNISDQWACSDECEAQDPDPDHALEHNKELLWRGLLHLVNRDCIREGDGPEMQMMWRIAFPQFWEGNHTKYIICAHLLLANINGCQPERVQQELIWDRVAKLKGCKGCNIPLDLVNEFLNNDFKAMLKRCNGQYTDQQVKRASQMGGAFGKEIDRLFSRSMGMEVDFDPQRKRPLHYTKDLATFVSTFADDGLFDYVPGRSFTAFPGFVRNNHIKSPNRLGKQIFKMSQKLDFTKRRNITPRCMPE